MLFISDFIHDLIILDLIHVNQLKLFPWAELDAGFIPAVPEKFQILEKFHLLGDRDSRQERKVKISLWLLWPRRIINTTVYLSDWIKLSLDHMVPSLSLSRQSSQSSTGGCIKIMFWTWRVSVILQVSSFSSSESSGGGCSPCWGCRTPDQLEFGRRKWPRPWPPVWPESGPGSAASRQPRPGRGGTTPVRSPCNALVTVLS